jgi:hypothetical protein
MTHPAQVDTRTPKEIEADRARFRRTLLRVMAVQVVTLLLLWFLQVAFSG